MLVQCFTCGKEFNKPNWAIRRSGRHHFCEHNCYAKWRKSLRLEQFLRFVNKTETCWIWTGSKTKAGYGHARVFNRRISFAHRLAWMLFRGPIPDGLQVLHNCPDGDNPSCVNPDHLWLGTQKDNMRDAVKKDQRAWGERHHNAKLRLVDIPLIVSQSKAGVQRKVIAHAFGVSIGAIAAVIHGKTWRRAQPIL